MPALPSSIIEPIWDQFHAVLPAREVVHPLGCHRLRISDRLIFDKLVQVLVFGCAYDRIADDTVSATMLRPAASPGVATRRGRFAGAAPTGQPVAFKAYHIVRFAGEKAPGAWSGIAVGCHDNTAVW